MIRIFLTLSFGLFVIPFGISQDLPSYVPADGLVAYYPFNGNANDYSGNGNHGTVNGATLSYNRNGDDNSAYDFQVLNWDSGNNGGDYIYIPHSSEFNFESFTLSAWVYRKSAGASNSPQHLTIMRKFEEGYNNPNGESWHFDIAHGTNNGGSILIGGVIEQSPSPATKFECASTNTIIEKEWTNVIMTYFDKIIKTFINGVESCSSTNNNITLNTLGTSGISIGMSVQANGNWGPFDGSIDDIGIWNRALTEQEIHKLYNSSTGDILLNGIVSAENHQIKNVADPTDAQDAATKNYVDSNINSFSGSYDDLTDKPTTYTQSQVDALIEGLQNQINYLKQRTVTTEIGFGQIYDLETGEICDEPEPMFCDSRFDLRFPYGGGDIKARLWWNESEVDVAFVYDKSFSEIQLSDVSSYYFCEHINDPNQACSDTDSPPTNFFGIYHTSEGNYYAVEFLDESTESFNVSFRYKLL